MDPSIVCKTWTKRDDRLLDAYVAEHGKKWKLLEGFFPGRTEISIKNRYNVLLRRKARDVKVALGLPLKSKKKKDINVESIFDFAGDEFSRFGEFGVTDNDDWNTW